MSGMATPRGTRFTNIIGFENNGDFGTDRERVYWWGSGVSTHIYNSLSRLHWRDDVWFGTYEMQGDFPFSPTKRISFSLLFISCAQDAAR